MRKVSPKQRAMIAEHGPQRRAWVEEVGKCMLCGRRDSLEVHEMLRGPHRCKAFARRECCLVLCNAAGCDCHAEAQNWPLAQQLAVKLEADPWYFDLDVIREVKNTGGILVTMADIRAAAKELGFLV